MRFGRGRTCIDILFAHSLCFDIFYQITVVHSWELINRLFAFGIIDRMGIPRGRYRKLMFVMLGIEIKFDQND